MFHVACTVKLDTSMSWCIRCVVGVEDVRFPDLNSSEIKKGLRVFGCLW
jgi:hypothetical protein